MFQQALSHWQLFLAAYGKSKRNPLLVACEQLVTFSGHVQELQDGSPLKAYILFCDGQVDRAVSHLGLLSVHHLVRVNRPKLSVRQWREGKAVSPVGLLREDGSPVGMTLERETGGALKIRFRLGSRFKGSSFYLNESRKITAHRTVAQQYQQLIAGRGERFSQEERDKLMAAYPAFCKRYQDLLAVP